MEPVRAMTRTNELILGSASAAFLGCYADDAAMRSSAAAFLDPLLGRPVNQGYVRVPKTRFPDPARRRDLDCLPLGEQPGPPIAESTRISAEAIDLG